MSSKKYTVKTVKLTKLEPKENPMMANEHGAKTYGEWCIKETARIGGDARYIEVEKKGMLWCRVERMVLI